MANDETTISLAGVNAPPLYRMVTEDDETVIKTYDTNTPMWKINGDIAGGAKAMTTAQRTATTPKAGELIFDTDLGVLFVGDGTTAGGTAVGGGGGGVVPGYRLSDDGVSLNFNPVTPIVDATGSNTVTLAPDHAYKVVATGGAVTLNANAPASGYWGLEGHLEIFVAGTGYVITGTNVVLANALEPDSVNNCTLRFHDGVCIISVEDHIAGYIVVNGATSGDGSLYYGIATSTNDYVAFDASLNGTTIPLAGAVAEGEKHIVGNGYTETTLTGAVDCGTSKFTVANLSLQNVVVNGGTMTLGDAYIPNGSTVTVSGGGLAVEKVTGAGSDSVIDLGKTRITVYKISSYISGTEFTEDNTFVRDNGGYIYSISGTLDLSDCKFRGGVASAGGAIYASSCTTLITDCEITGNTATVGNQRGGGGIVVALGNMTISNSIVSGNIQSYSTGKDIYIGTSTNLILAGGNVIGETMFRNSTGYANITFNGSNKIDKVNPVNGGTSTGPCTVTIASGAIVDLTGNANETPIAPGGGITFEAGGATVLYSSGAVSGSYMMDNVTLPAGAKLTNTAVVDLGGTGSAACYGSASGATFTSGFFMVSSGGVVNNITAGHGVFFRVTSGGVVNNTTAVGGALIAWSGGVVNEPTISSGGTLIVSSGASALLVTSNTGASVTVAEGGYITYKE